MTMILSALNDYVASATEFEPRPNHVGASEIGLCARRVCYSKKGTEAAEGSWGAHVRGTTMERCFWEPAMRAKYGKKLLFSGPDQKRLSKGQLSCTPDGILTGLRRDALAYLGIKDIGATCILLECKSIDPRFDISEAKAENVFQVQVQLGMVREMTRHKPEYALITYTDASFWDEVTEHAIRFDPLVYEQAKARAALILGSDPQDLKPEGWIAGARECAWCPFAGPCGMIRTDVPAGEGTADAQFVAEIEDLVTEYIGIKSEADEKAEAMRDVQHRIKERLQAKGIRKIPGVVTWSKVKGRTTLDKERLAQAMSGAGLDIADYETTGEGSDRLQIF